MSETQEKTAGMTVERRQRGLPTGRIVGRSVRLLGRNLPVFVGIAFVVGGPALAVSLFVDKWSDEWSAGLALLDMLLRALLYTLAAGLVLRAGAYRLDPERDTDTESEGPRWGAVLAVCFLLGIALRMGPLVQVTWVSLMEGRLDPWIPTLMSPFVVLVGFSLYCRFYLALPVALLEGAGAREALGRARQVTRHELSGICRLVLFLYLMHYLLQLGMNLLLGDSPFWWAPLYTESLDPAERFLFTAGRIALDLLLLMMSGLVQLFVYEAIQEKRDGLRLQDIGAVFD